MEIKYIITGTITVPDGSMIDSDHGHSIQAPVIHIPLGGRTGPILHLKPIFMEQIGNDKNFLIHVDEDDLKHDQVHLSQPIIEMIVSADKSESKWITPNISEFIDLLKDVESSNSEVVFRLTLTHDKASTVTTPEKTTETLLYSENDLLSIEQQYTALVPLLDAFTAADFDIVTFTLALFGTGSSGVYATSFTYRDPNGRIYTIQHSSEPGKLQLFHKPFLNELEKIPHRFTRG